MKKSIVISERMYPNPAILVSCSNDNKDNIITLGMGRNGVQCAAPDINIYKALKV